MITGLWPILIMAAGALMYLLATKAQLIEIGRLLFFAGALAFAFFVAGKTFAI